MNTFNCFIMEEAAMKFFHDHKNPIVKLDLLGSKLFLRASSNEETKLSEQNQNSIEGVLRHTRVERRCARAKAEWCPEIGLSKVSKVVKGLLENFGYQDKRGIFMYPEEMLLLVETNRMEVSYRDVPLTLQECYQIISQTAETGLRKYLVYKKFVLHGYRLTRYKEVLRRKIKDDTKQSSGLKTVDCLNVPKRPKPDEFEDSPNKSLKNILHDLEDTNKQSTSVIDNVFERIRKNAPKEYHSFSTATLYPEYCVFLPNNKSRTSWNFSLYICEKELLDQPTRREGPTSIYAVYSEDNISLCRMYNVNLPVLPS